MRLYKKFLTYETNIYIISTKHIFFDGLFSGVSFISENDPCQTAFCRFLNLIFFNVIYALSTKQIEKHSVWKKKRDRQTPVFVHYGNRRKNETIGRIEFGG